MSSEKGSKVLGWNTAVTIFSALLIALLGALSRESYLEMRAAHDDILTVKLLMVRHGEFDVAISEMKQRTTSIETALAQIRARQSAIEIEIQKLKDKHP